MALGVLKCLVVWSVLPNKNNNYRFVETATTHISTEILIILPFFSMKVNVKIVLFHPLGIYIFLQDTDLNQWKTVISKKHLVQWRFILSLRLTKGYCICIADSYSAKELAVKYLRQHWVYLLINPQYLNITVNI